MEMESLESLEEYERKQDGPSLWRPENDQIYPAHCLRFQDGVLVECRIVRKGY